MRRHLSLSRLLRNDKLMMVVSLIAAVVIWALVVYGPGNLEERAISGVPIPVALSEDVIETYDLYIVKVDKEAATVKVSGTRGEIGRLSAQDIQIAVDTSSITKAGQYNLRYRVVSSGDYDVKIVGDDTVTVVCDEFYEDTFDVVVDVANLTVSDTQQYQLGDPVVSDSSVVDNKITVKGPKSDVKKIDRVEAIVPDEMALSEQATFVADLVAYDKKNRPVESIQFLTGSENQVTVNVPVLNYYKVQLQPELLNVPSEYAKNKNLYTVEPAEFEFWSVPNKYDKFIGDLNKELVFDFDLLDPSMLERTITLEDVEKGIRLLNGSETIKVSLNLGDVTTKSVTIPITKKNFKVKNLPDGYTCTFESSSTSSVVLCGPKDLLSKIKPEDIVLSVDFENKVKEGSHSVVFRLETGNGKVWVCYSTDVENPKHGVDVQVKIAKKAEKAKNNPS